jgi:FkbM family methyltransferase
VVLDIGANTGLFAMAAAASNPDTKIHAYEIVPDVVVHLVSNLVENEMLSRVEVHSYGIGSSDTTMRVPSQASAPALPSAFSSRIEFSDGARVMFQTLDQQSYFAEGASNVLVKIDVEGTENEILRHGNDFLARFSPDIICELLPDECKVEDVDSHLRANQYKCYKILADRLQFEAVLKPDPAYHDWLFTALEVGELKKRISPLQVF